MLAGMTEPEEIVSKYHARLERSVEEQEAFLQHVLAKHSGCEYLQRHGLHGRTDSESFKQHIPVIEYDAIEQDVQRMMQGHPSPILTCDPVLEFFASSGTSTGKRKLFPITQSYFEQLERTICVPSSFSFLAFGKTVPVLIFVSAGQQFKSPTGLPVGPATCSMLKRAGRGSLGKITEGFVSPPEVLHCLDFQQSMYCHLVCGLLRASEAVSLGSWFASGVATAMNILKQNWEELSHDIETGKLSSKITDPPVRAVVSELLGKPNPELASFIRAECGKESWEGILLRLWPNLKLITCIATGSMLQYVDYLNFLSGSQLPIVTSGYGGSEGAFGCNPYVTSPPHETTFVLYPDQAYFEFLLLNRDEETSGTPESDSGKNVVGLADVEEGQEYELVVTTHCGLWRFRVGDMLKCAGFYHKAPKFQYVGRRNVILSINTDKTEEKEIVQAVNTAAKLHFPAETKLLDFTSCTDTSSIPGSYVIFLELWSSGNLPAQVKVGTERLEEACLAIEAALAEPYRRGRNIGTVGPLQLKVVETGTFDKLTRLAVQMGSGSSQYKTPRTVKSGSPALEVLHAAATQTATSPSLPPHAILNPIHSVQSDL